MIRSAYVTALFVSILTLKVSAQNPLPEVLSIREFEAADEASSLVYINYLKQVAMIEERSFNGVHTMIARGERGKRVNKFINLWGFDFLAARNYYFPGEDEESYPQYTAHVLAHQRDIVAPKLPEGKIITSPAYGDFIILGYEKLLNPQFGEVVGVRYFEIESSKQAEFEAHVINEVHPMYQKYIDGYWVYIGKSDRGSMKGKYVLLSVFDTYNRRQEYYPKPDKPAETLTKAAEPLTETFNKTAVFLGDQDIPYTDYIIMR
ncbi:MAG: hypothetical protein OEX02_09150 [Cyclobacteriaceae bacterium]|nr:hypothetical protein [Cyclobacteriaceae bacterium]